MSHFKPGTFFETHGVASGEVGLWARRNKCVRLEQGRSWCSWIIHGCRAQQNWACVFVVSDLGPFDHWELERWGERSRERGGGTFSRDHERYNCDYIRKSSMGYEHICTGGQNRSEYLGVLFSRVQEDGVRAVYAKRHERTHSQLENSLSPQGT